MNKEVYDQFNIYIDRIKHDNEENLQCVVNADFLEINEAELQFQDPVELQGEAYLTEDHLIIHVKAKTCCNIPCKICNEIFSYKIVLEPSTFTVALEEIKGAIFNYKDFIREALLLLVPPFAECHGGTCPLRTEVKKYLGSQGQKDKPACDTYHPFQDL